MWRRHTSGGRCQILERDPNMARQLDLADIQGGILRDYGEQFPKGRFIFLSIGDDKATARQFLGEVRGWVTTAVRWQIQSRQLPR